MIAKFILIVIFAHGHGPRTNYAMLGEYATIQACRAAAQAVNTERVALNIYGSGEPRFVCATK